MDSNTATQLLFPLADAVQFNLYLCHDKKLPQPYYVKGYGALCLPVSPDHDLPFKVTVVASGFGKNKVWVMLKVVGDLWALLSYDGTMKELTFTLLDAGRIKDTPDMLSGKKLKDVFDTLIPAMAGTWIREERNITWSRLDATVGMDDPTMGHAQEACRPDHSVGADQA